MNRWGTGRDFFFFCIFIFLWNLKTRLRHSTHWCPFLANVALFFEGNGGVFSSGSVWKIYCQKKIGGFVMKRPSWDWEVPVPHWLSHQIRPVCPSYFSYRRPSSTSPDSCSPQVQPSRPRQRVSARVFGDLALRFGFWGWWVKCDWQIWHLWWCQTFRNFCHMLMWDNKRKFTTKQYSSSSNE